jgi:uncharacterized SAM-binding protein YcdF (DUF218 family)
VLNLSVTRLDSPFLKLWKQCRRIFKFLVIGFGGLIAVQAVYFTAVFNWADDASPSEAIVVFRGTDARIAAGYELAKQRIAPLILISPGSERQRKAWDRRYGLPDGASHLTEELALTTLENAWYTARIIQDHGLTSVTLVTSDYHMPRSLAFLKLFLWGQGVNVRIYKVGPANGNLPDAPLTFAKLVYNEAIECWGSLVELAVWRLTGKTLRTQGEETAWLLGGLRSLVLMDVNPLW